MAEVQGAAATSGAEGRKTLGLTGLTINAMALIAPGAFLWLTYAMQSQYGAPSAGMSMWFGGSAVVPALTKEWHLSETAAGWLTLSVQIGFVAGTLSVGLSRSRSWRDATRFTTSRYASALASTTSRLTARARDRFPACSISIDAPTAG